MWQPRLMEAIDWIAEQVAADKASGRAVIASEIKGSADIAGVRLKGVADRIDSTDGLLAIVDYKTGAPPSPKAMKAGFAMQLGLLGLIADRNGFAGLSGKPTVFEYWTTTKDKGQFGKRVTVKIDDFIAVSAASFDEAAGKWLTGSEPFTAKLHPEYAPYSDYDHLMRLAEWYGRER